MQIHKFTLLAVFLAIAVLLTACGARPAVAGTNTNPPPATQQAAPPTAQNSAASCANSLVPVKQGATWTYSNTDGSAASSSFTATISAVRVDGFTAAIKFDDGTSVDQQWLCKPEGLVAAGLGAGQAPFGLTVEGTQAQLSTANASGVTVPANVQPGMKWPYGLDIAGTLAQGSLTANLSGNAATSFEALGTESVTVPAGTFDATKVQGVSTVKVSAEFHGLSLPITSVVNTTFWLAPGVGLVKSTETGELAGTAVSATTELQSYSLP